jgi:hypothetical protein
MSAYTEQLAKIRAARKSRDEARDALYAAKMRHLALLKAKKQAVNRYLPRDPATEKNIAALRAEIATIKKSLDEVLRRLAAIDELTRRIDDLAAQREKYAADELQASGARREALQRKLAELDKDIAALREKVTGAAHEKASLQARRAELEAELKRKQAALDQLVKGQGGDGSGSPPDLDQALAASRAVIARQSEAVKGRTGAIAGLVDGLFLQVTPQQLIEQWDDAIPIALLPLRIETKFKLEGDTRELWVRIFPDEIAVVTHEKTLTSTEIDYGTAYWAALWAASGDDQKKTAWRMLADKFGPNRSAWVAIQTKPVNWGSADIKSASDLQAPTFDLTKPASWTEAPHTRIMPDRFVLLGYRGGQLVRTQIGAFLSDIVTLGPAPQEDADNPSLTRDSTDNRLSFGEDFQWIADFDRAVRAGLGFRVPLASMVEAREGFDQLLVIGLKASSDENDGKALVEDLLDNHHYSRKGLALVRQGTPTNNTDERDAGYSSKDPLQALSYFVETGDPLFTPSDKPEEATDGQRLAEYLGIEYAPLQYIANADGKDNVESVAMNKALYAGTFGYYLGSMLNEVMDDETLGEVRHHFTNYVTGRGPVAAIRVGNQPYGVLTTSAFGKWKYPEGSRIVARVPSFYTNLYKLLAHLDQQWRTIAATLAHIGKAGDTGAKLMAVLGLQPTSAEYFQRIGYSLDDLKNREDFLIGGKYFWDTFKAGWDAYFGRLALAQFGYRATRPDGSLKPTPLLLQLIFQHYQTAIDVSNLIDSQPPSEETGIKPYNAALGLNYIHWLLANLDSDKLEKEDFGGTAKPTSLLYMLLRHALLHETSLSIARFLGKNAIGALELVRSRKFMNITSAPSVSHWEMFQAPVGQVIAAEASSMPLFAYMHSARFSAPADLDVVANLNAHKWALGVLKDLPTARLERALAEHVDCLTYRLDAWQTSLFDLRLRDQRRLGGKSADRRKGIYIGAQGYLENVKPNLQGRTKVSERELPAALRENKDNLYTAAGNGGYVHAPSLNHATAAAILRNGYMTHATQQDREMMNVNLSSERVRRAAALVEGIRNGQTLETLLGYQFERGLHDWTTRAVAPVILNHLVPVFRTAFPIKKTKVPQAGKVTGPEETVDDFHVVNGLALARTKIDFPYGVSLPTLSTAQIEAIKKEKLNIENSLDAVRDLLTGECAYQLALGNFDRASAVMQSISSAQIPSDIQVISSSRGTNLAFTHRVAVHFDPAFSANPWPAVAMTVRANAEPGLNHWLGSILGDPATIRCRVTAVDAAGNTLKRADNSDLAGAVALAELHIQPLDFVYLIRNRLAENGSSEIESRVRDVFARREALGDGVIVKIAFADADAPGDLTRRSFAEILPLANLLRELVTGARPLGARDFAIQSKDVTAATDNPDGIDVANLRGRVQTLVDAFTTLIAPLDGATADAQTLRTETAVNALRARLRALADAGFPLAFPQSAVGFGNGEIDVLTTQGKSVSKRLAAMVDKRDALTAKADAAGTRPPEQVSLLTQAARLMLGDDFALLPHFAFSNAAEVAQAFLARAQLLEHATNTLGMPLPTDEWLHGVATVRPKMHRLEMIRLLNDAFSETPLEIAPIQIPYRANDTWLGVQFPAGFNIDHDTLSIVLHAPQSFDAAGTQTGLLLDQWVETIPNKEEVTGITFNFNNPNSAPPQVVLLAVTPDIMGHWTWDHLVDGVLDTYARAKLRAVEPDQVDAQGLVTTFLPAVISEFSTSKSNISLDYAFNIQFVAQAVATMAARA